MAEELPDKGDYYQELRDRIDEFLKDKPGHQYADYLILAPDLFYTLIKLQFDSEVSVMLKAKIGLAIAYFVSPVDVIPEAVVGPVGYADDIVVAAKVLDMVINQEGKEKVEEYWPGDEEVLSVIQKILNAMNELIGKGMWKEIKRLIGF